MINDVLWTNLNNRGGIEFQSVQGIAYVEGLWIHGQVDPNPDSTNWYGIDGIRLGTGSSNTTLIVQNTRIEDRTGAQSPQAAHADCIQCFGGVKELRIDTVTCRSQFQGLMFKQEVGTYFGPSDIRRMDFANVPQRYRAGYLLNLVQRNSFVSDLLLKLLHSTGLHISNATRHLQPSVSGSNQGEAERNARS